jgi:hypothetical protein
MRLFDSGFRSLSDGDYLLNVQVCLLCQSLVLQNGCSQPLQQ